MKGRKRSKKQASNTTDVLMNTTGVAVQEMKRKRKGVVHEKESWTLPRNFLNTTPLYGDDNEENRPVLTEKCNIDYFWSLNVRQLSFYNGRVVVEEYPTYAPHSVVLDELGFQIRQAAPFMRGLMDTSFNVAPGVVSQADLSHLGNTVPRPGPGNPGASNPRGDPWPTIIVEVCNQRSLPTGINKANDWLGAGTGVQMVIVIKINRRTAAGVSMVALRFERNAIGPTYAVSFGTRALVPVQTNTINALGGAQVFGVGHGGVACNAAALPTYQFRLPHNLITVGMPAAPAFAIYSVDLYLIQQRVLEYM